MSSKKPAKNGDKVLSKKRQLQEEKEARLAESKYAQLYDYWGYVIATIRGFVSVYGILMGTMFVVFVPMECTDDDTGERGPCTLEEQLKPTDDVNKAALALNCISLSLLVLLQFVNYRREVFLVKNLDEDPNCPATALQDTIVEFKGKGSKVGKELDQHNFILYAFAILNLLALLTNIVFSSYVAFGEKYAGFSTVTTLLSYASAAFLINYNSLFAGAYGYHYGLALSAQKFVAAVFNDVDLDLYEEYGVEKIRFERETTEDDSPGKESSAEANDDEDEVEEES